MQDNQFDVKNKTIIRVFLLILLDLLILALADCLALFVRFDFSVNLIPDQYIENCIRFFPLRAVITVVLFYLMHMYHFVWRAVSINDVAHMLLSILVTYAASTLVCSFSGCNMPISYYILTLFLQIFAFIAMRSSLRFINMLQNEMSERRKLDRIMIIGSGQAGAMLLREISGSRKIEGKVVCIIDDNRSKWGKYLGGVKIIGGRDKIISAAEEMHITQIVLAIPSAAEDDKRDILEICKMTKCHLRTLPGIYQLVNGDVTVDAIKDVDVEDLLGREPVRLDQTSLKAFINEKTVMVTGGGGSIGAELCRQVAKYSPRKLIILDIYENNAYDIQQELKRNFGPALDLCIEIASVRDSKKIDELFAKHRPDVVFHAAAHKHVPLMEDCPSEAIKNNIFGTYNVICAAEKYEVKKFVMISTDKAVNPTNVMGATKRFCEMIIQSRHDSKTEFCCVRFGNVLGSNGSVVPLFKKQIEKGGPITLTDKRIIRYFMTIPEAVQLVLEAGSMAGQGQIYVLDMGKPVKILTLAENLIRLSGMEPYKDIDIVEIGLRPGEKLYEEMLMSSETLSSTKNKMIFVEEQRTIARETIEQQLLGFSQAFEGSGKDSELVKLLKDFVPTYSSPDAVNGAAGNGEYPPPPII